MLTAETVRSLLNYDLETGILRWKSTTSNRVRAGDEAGSIGVNGYRYIGICGKRIKATWVIWLIVYSRLPVGVIDHVNRVRDDNRLGNLREATESQNRCNVTKYKNNRSGYKGVWWQRNRQRWVAEITINGEKKWLGRFKTSEEAHQAYSKAAQELHGEFSCVM